MRRLIIMVGVMVVLAGAFATQAPAPAQASQSQDSGTNHSPLCFYWNFREYRDGLFFSGLLWEIKQHATWCNDGYGHFNGAPQVTHTHREGSSWNFGGWDSIQAIHKSNPNRWFFRIDATEIGNASGVFNEHNYPFIRLTIYPNIGSNSWAASCGCKATLGPDEAETLANYPDMEMGVLGP